MALVTLQVLEGLERGQVHADLPTPVTIGREDDNSVRLNDERVSRFHAKIQEDGQRVILTDLDSTNGTRVNGHPVQMRVLQVGDQLSIGRCVLLYGSRDEISARSVEIGGSHLPFSQPEGPTLAVPGENVGEAGAARDFTSANSSDLGDELGELFPNGPPEAPNELLPVQRAQVSDILAFAHEEIRMVIHSAIEDLEGEEQGPRSMQVDWVTWQRLISLEMDLAGYLRKLAEPD